MFIRYASAAMLDVIDVHKRDSLFRYGGKSAFEQSSNIDRLGNAVRVAKLNSDFLPVIYLACHGDVPNNKGDMFRWGNWDDKNCPELLRYADDEYIGIPGTTAFRKGGHVFQTFIGKGFYKEHRNYDPSLSVGFLADAVANEAVKGVEVLAMLDRVKDADLVRSVEAGYAPSCSMGASLQYCICSACGNKATDISSQCNHQRMMKGKKYIDASGQQQMYHDDCRGVHFIELSSVGVPADPVAFKVGILRAASMDSSVGKLITASLSLIDKAVAGQNYAEAEAMADDIIAILEESRCK